MRGRPLTHGPHWPTTSRPRYAATSADTRSGQCRWSSTCSTPAPGEAPHGASASRLRGVSTALPGSHAPWYPPTRTARTGPRDAAPVSRTVPTGVPRGTSSTTDPAGIAGSSRRRSPASCRARSRCRPTEPRRAAPGQQGQLGEGLGVGRRTSGGRRRLHARHGRARSGRSPRGRRSRGRPGPTPGRRRSRRSSEAPRHRVRPPPGGRPRRRSGARRRGPCGVHRAPCRRARARRGRARARSRAARRPCDDRCSPSIALPRTTGSRPLLRTAASLRAVGNPAPPRPVSPARSTPRPARSPSRAVAAAHTARDGGRA